MTWHQIQMMAAAGVLAGAYTLGYSSGRHAGREAALQGAVASFQQREKINNDVSKLGSVDLCIGLGGLPDECATLMRGLDETTESEPSGKNVKR